MTQTQIQDELNRITKYLEENFSPPLWLAVRIEDGFNFIVFSEN
jgi:hypothetical protein